MTGKQAVVIIHGVGEQVPMDTLRGFVETVWTSDSAVCDPQDSIIFDRLPKAWSKPDEISGDFELRRITTNSNRIGVRTDFFEFYWAHLMKETKVSQVWAWARVLLLRLPRRVPRNLLPVWLLLWALALLIFVGLVFLAAPEPIRADLLGWSQVELAITNAVAILVWTVVAGSLVNYAGDAARYLHVRPPNIDVRHSIRTAGVDLLGKLHNSGKYDRIVVVGHSLGTVIGYDILSYFWQSCHTKLKPSSPQPTEALAALEAQAREAQKSGLEPDRYRAAQVAYFDELRRQSCPWLVTDFITLGSPLAHADVLMARDSTQLREKQADREMPACPPYLEEGVEFSFDNKETKTRCPNHSALFGPTRWTNIYFPYRGLIFGDPIGGAVAPLFGPGVKDVPVETNQRAGVFTHTLYWSRPGGPGAADHIAALRAALRICG